MPGVPHLLAINGFNFTNNGFIFGAGRLSIDVPPFAILTAGAGSNVAVGNVPVLPAIVGAYCLESIEFESTTGAAGTLAAATFDLKANGVSLLTAPIALVGITGNGLRLLTAGPATATVQNPFTTPAVLTLVLSQTVISANAGNIAARIHLMLLPT